MVNGRNSELRVSDTAKNAWKEGDGVSALLSPAHHYIFEMNWLKCTAWE